MQVGFLGLRAFSSLCQSVDFVNLLNPSFERGFRRAYSYARNAQTLFQQTGDVLRETGEEGQALL